MAITAYPNPTPGPIANDEVLSIDVFPDPNPSMVSTLITIKYPGMKLQEVVFDGMSFTSAFSAASTAVGVVDGVYGAGTRYTIERNTLWPDSPTLVVYAVDDAGTLATVTPRVYVLSEPATTPAPPVPTFPTSTGPGTDCDFVLFDEAHFLDLFDRIMDEGYLAPIKRSNVGGYEIYQAIAKVMTRASLAVHRLACGSTIIYAEGGSYAEGVVELYREALTLSDVTVKGGSIVTTSTGGRDFITLDDVTFTPADYGPLTTRVRAVDRGWEWNVPGKTITTSGQVLDGAIDTVKVLVEDPVYADPNILVRQILPTSGGAAPMLDGLGQDRGLPRAVNESDPAYRYRIRQLPDTVSPAALKRALDVLVKPWGITYQWIETFELSYQTCYDAPNATYAGSPAYDPNLFCYDDPRPLVPFRNRWLDEIEQRATVIVVVSNLPAIQDVGMAFDDTAMSGSALVTSTGGSRAFCAYDVPSTFAFGLQGGYDGFDPRKNAVYLGIWQVLQRIKAAGVAAILELKGE